MQFHVLLKVNLTLPTVSSSVAPWNLPDSALLADPWFIETAPIDRIIGAEYYKKLLKVERRNVTVEGPTLQRTVLAVFLMFLLERHTP